MKKQPFDQNKAYRDFIRMQRDVGKKPKRTGGQAVPFTSTFEDHEYFLKEPDLKELKEDLHKNHKKQYENLPPNLKEVVDGFHEVTEKIVKFKRELAAQGHHAKSDPERGVYMKENAQTNVGHNTAFHIFNELKEIRDHYQNKTNNFGKTYKYPQLKIPKVLQGNTYPYYVMLKFVKRCIQKTYRVYVCFLRHHNETNLTHDQKLFWKEYEEGSELIKELRKHRPESEKKKKRKPRKGKKE